MKPKVRGGTDLVQDVGLRPCHLRILVDVTLPVVPARKGWDTRWHGKCWSGKRWSGKA